MSKFGIKHNLKIQEDGVTISGQILDVEWGEFGRNCGYIIEEDEFCIYSLDSPEFDDTCLYIFHTRLPAFNWIVFSNMSTT